jgi:xylan 1,4-beta-xylosidase
VVVKANIDLRRILDEYGFKKTEIHMNEWNYFPDHSFNALVSRDGAQVQRFCERVSGLHGAAFSACVLLGLQDSPADMANYYTADNFLLGMFNFYGVPSKTYHAFRAFKILVDHPARVAVEGSKLGEANIAAGLSADGRELVIVASNYRSTNPQIELTVDNLPWSGPSKFDVLLLDESKNLDSIRKEESADRTIKITQPLPAPGVMLVVVRPK